MKMTNQEIYMISIAYTQSFEGVNTYIPAKANFFLQKNMQTIIAAAEEISQSRIDIAKEYGQLNEKTQEYQIPQEKIDIVNKELNDLLSLEQELEIKKINIDAFGDVEFTPAQMQAIMFMVED